MDIPKLILFLAAFGVLSYGSSLIVNTISVFTHRLRVPPFIFSFFIGGLLTSVAEVAVGINAISLNQPEIFVGSILGGTLVIFLLVIPLMTLLSRGLPIKKHISNRRLMITLIVFATPALLAVDSTITHLEAILLILLYLSLIFIIKTPGESFSKVERAIKQETKVLVGHSVLHLAAGTALVFLSSRFIVEQTLVYSEYFHISTFVVSMIVIAIGTTLPEIALAIKAATSHQLKAQDIAVGDFLGSAATNVLLFGIFTLVSGDFSTAKSFTTIFLCTLLAVISFYAVATRGLSIITVKESYVLIAVYLLFVATQFMTA